VGEAAPLGNLSLAFAAVQHHARDACGLKQRCTPNMPARKILRSIHEAHASSLATDAYLTSRRQRKMVEMLLEFTALQIQAESKPE
jgi:hypothetical protein